MVQKNLRNSIEQWLTRMLRLSCSSIQWVGLPDEIDTVALERYLTRSGSAIIGYDEVAGVYVVGQNASVGKINIYGYPDDRRGIFMNGETMQFDTKNSVIIYNNSDRMSDIYFYTEIAEFMAGTDVAVKVNMNTQKTMPIIPTTQEQQLSVENVYKDLVNNIPYIMVDSQGFDVEGFKGALQFDNRSSFTADLMIQVQREYWNRFLTFVGINNVNVEKRERTNVPEIQSNLNEIEIMRRDRLNSREIACKQMKNIFGLDVSVSYYSDNRVTVAGNGNDTSGDLSGDGEFGVKDVLNLGKGVFY